MEAALYGYEDIVKDLISAGADTTIVDYGGATALDLAKSRNNKTIIQLLEQAQPPSNTSKFIKKNKKKVPVDSIWQATTKGDLNILNWYLSNGTNINIKNDKGENLLMLAAVNDNDVITKQLIKAHIELDAQDNKGNTALMKALKERNMLRVSMLLEAGASVKIKNSEGASALKIAIAHGLDEFIQELINRGANVQEADEEGYTLLMIASYLDRIAIIPLLISAGADVNAKDNDGITALMIAASRGFDKAVHQLLAAGASSNAQDVLGKTALDYARGSKKQATIKLLEETQKAAAGEIGNTPLIKAVKNNKVDKVKQILKENKININAQNTHGETALAIAARWGRLPIIKLLLQAGAQVNTAEETGITPLQSAVMAGHIKIAQLLLDNGADINARDTKRGRTPLNWVVRMTEGSVKKISEQIPVKKSLELLNLLLSRNADPAIEDFKRITPLKWARALGLQPLAKVLEKNREY